MVRVLTRARIRTALAGLSGRLRAVTIRQHALVPLLGCLSAAVEDGLLPGNPAARLGRFVRSDVLPSEAVEPYTRAELGICCAAPRPTCRSSTR